MKTNFRSSVCLITGGAGFIGGHVVEALLEAGAEVYVLDDGSTGDWAWVSSKIPPERLLRNSITESPGCFTKISPSDFDYVFHLAARPSVPLSFQEPLRSFDSNLGGTLKLLETFRNSKRLKAFVYTSSSAVYGTCKDSKLNEKTSAGELLSPYAIQKKAGEDYGKLYARTYGLPWIGLRPFNIFGPRQKPGGSYAAVIPNFLQAALHGTSLPIFGEGNQTRDFLYVGDAALGFLQAASVLSQKRSLSGSVFNLGGGTPISLLTLAGEVLKVTGSSSRLDFLPPRDGDIQDSCSDPSEIQTVLNFKPQTSLLEGLRETAHALRS
jgi:nucleoside-diphosphate-sugar epimerase